MNCGERRDHAHTGGLDGIMYDVYSDRIILTNHSRPVGTLTAIAAETGDIVGVADLEDTAPEGAASDGMGRIFVNNEGTNTIQVIDVATKRLFSGCSGTSVVVDPSTHTAYLFQREYGPPPAGTLAPAPGQRAPRGPIVAGW